MNHVTNIVSEVSEKTCKASIMVHFLHSKFNACVALICVGSKRIKGINVRVTCAQLALTVSCKLMN